MTCFHVFFFFYISPDCQRPKTEQTFHEILIFPSESLYQAEGSWWTSFQCRELCFSFTRKTPLSSAQHRMKWNLPTFCCWQFQQFLNFLFLLSPESLSSRTSSFDPFFSWKKFRYSNWIFLSLQSSLDSRAC